MMIVRTYESMLYRLDELQYGDSTTGHYVLKKKSLFSRSKAIAYPTEEEALDFIIKYNMKEV